MNRYKVQDGPGVGILLGGTYKVQVIDPHTGLISEDRPWKKNLILNCGMNALAGNVRIADAGAVAIVGSGSRPNFFGGGTSAITQSGNLVYLYDISGNITDFTAASSSYENIIQLGDVLEYANFSRSFVTAVIDARTLQVRETYNIDVSNAQTFTVWKTSQSNLEMESKRNSSYWVGSSSLVGWNCGTQISGNVAVMRRTYQFPAEVGTNTYTEMGISWTATKGASSSFARALIDPPITVYPDFILRMTHEITASYTPNYERYITASILNWPNPDAIATNTYATESIQSFSADGSLVFSYVDTNGSARGFGVLEPYGNSRYYSGTSYWGNSYFATAASRSLLPYTASTNWQSSSATWLSTSDFKCAYVTNSFEIFKSCSFDINDAVSDRIWVVGIGYYWYNFPSIDIQPWEQNANGILLRFNAPQTKTADQKLFLVWRWTWDRILS